MKVIHLISGGDSGGAKTHVLSLLQHLNQTITAQLVCFRDGPFAEEARQMGIPTMICGGNNVFRTRRKLAAYIREGGYEIIHCHGSRANMIGAMLRKVTGLPVVTTVHSDYRLDYMGRPLSHLTFGTINALALRRLDYRIGVSDAMVDLLISRGFPADRFYTIYNGIDFTPPPTQGDRLEYLRSLGADVDENSVVVGIAARMNPVKDMATLVRGFAAGYAKCPRLRLLIAGDGPEKDKLTALAAELGVERQVCFAGWISGGMDRFYSALDINALTSLSETFPYALTEGARFHLATVSTAVGGIPYLIDQDVNGYLFQPGDWQALGNDLAALGNDDELRRRLGEKLYEKASTQFSIQKTVSTQLQIYASILRRHRRRSSARDGVVICGAYGRGNAGDDAILEAILQEMRSIDPDMPITVLSKDPRSTRLTYRVRAVHRSNFLAWHAAMWNSRLYINGGGSLIQDVPSRRSLWFYLANIRAAKRAGNRVQMYGCGIGPVTRESHRSLAAKIINKYVDVITLREPDSMEELESFGVQRPEILLCSDPALVLAAPSELDVDAYLTKHGLDPQGKYICLMLRTWYGFDSKTQALAACADWAYRELGLTPVFLSLNIFHDSVAAQRVAQHMKAPYHILDDWAEPELLVGLLGKMDVVVSMRLHGLIFSSLSGAPLVGVSYDPKIESFLRYLGSGSCIGLGDVTEDALRRLIQEAVDSLPRREELRAKAQRLKDVERGNIQAVARLLEQTK